MYFSPKCSKCKFSQNINNLLSIKIARMFRITESSSSQFS